MYKKNKKSNTLTESFSNFLLELPTPSSISSMWNMGFLLGLTMLFQIMSGIILSISYLPSCEHAMESTIQIMRNMNNGWIFRFSHSTGASALFVLLYSHMLRGMYFSSYSCKKSTWISGIIILIMSMATAFMGYVLPWGQMSFWGATVITNTISAIPLIGEEMVKWIWGNFSVSQPTLNRFFSMHFLIPMLILLMIMIHLIFLHSSGSSNPLGTQSDLDKVEFFPKFLMKDIMTSLMLMLMITMIICNFPMISMDSENFNKANPLLAPKHIQPEWYFLFAYAILRAVPSKLGGVICLIMSISMFMTLSLKKEMIKSKKFLPLKKIMMSMFVSTALILTWVGGSPVESPYTVISQMFSMIYFTLLIL